MIMKKLTKEQAVVISGFTGILCGEFSDFHADVEKRLGRGVQTFEFGFKEFMAEIKKLYEADFIEMGTVDNEAAKAQEGLAELHLVWNKNRDECVGFLDIKDAQYTATGDDSGMFGVTALGDYFRDLNDEYDNFETEVLMIEAQEQSHD